MKHMRVVIECPACRRVTRGRMVGVFGDEEVVDDLAAALTGLIDGQGKPRVCPGCGVALHAQGAKIYLVYEQ